jgi:photosystem II stability/assembly factor-like uncharacterized protein
MRAPVPMGATTSSACDNYHCFWWGVLNEFPANNYYMPILICILFCLASVPGLCQNTNSWEKTGSNGYFSAQYLTDSKLIVVGTSGKILLSDDGGQSWKANNQDNSIGFITVSFMDSLHGVLGSFDGKIFGSVDGGHHWKLLAGPILDNLEKLLFLSSDTVFACGNSGLILRSTNGGIVWDSLKSTITQPLHNLYFFPDHSGYAIGDSGTILYTNNGGNSWNRQQTDSSLNLFGIDFLDSHNGVISAEQGYLYSTQDQGTNWVRTRPDPTYAMTLQSVTYLSPTQIIVDGRGGAFFRTIRNGLIWDKINLPKEIRDIKLLFNSVYSKTKKEGITIGYPELILSTTDSGASWKQRASCPARESFINKISFIDSSVGFAVGDHNLILKTTNAGDTWVSLHEDFGPYLYTSMFDNKDSGLVCGWNGWLEKTTDGGKTFTQKPESQYRTKFEGAYRIDDRRKFLVGDSLIWKTIDGGDHWNPTIWNGTLFPVFHKIVFPSPDIGFCYATFTRIIQDSLYYIYGKLFKSTNAGDTWDTLDYGSESYIHDMFFWNEHSGVIVTDSGSFKTDDGGKTWRMPAFPGGGIRFNCINFLDQNIGFGAGSYGTMYLTTDAGESWKIDLANSFDNLPAIDIVFPDSNTVIASGYQGFIKKHFDKGLLTVHQNEGSNINEHYLWITLRQNPASTRLPCTLYGNLGNGHFTLKIYDILGRLVSDLTHAAASEVTSTFSNDIIADVSSVPTGVYLIVLSDGTFSHSEEFIISK